MDSFVITWRELLIIVAVVLAIYIAEMLLLLRTNRGFRRWKPEVDAAQPKIDALESEIEQLREQIVAIRQPLEDRPIPQPQYAQSASSPSYFSSQAVRWRNQGLGRGIQVAAGCGTSRGEAELIVAMHQARP